MIEADGSHVLLGGGVGPIVGGTRIPTWHAGSIDPALLTMRWAGDHLPPSPPRTLSSFGLINPPIGVRPALTWGVSQTGFARGFLTTGGMGGAGLATAVGNQHGGAAGHGGDILITLGATTLLTSRDIDIATGTEVEVLTPRYFLPPLVTKERLVCTASGAHGGFGQRVGSIAGDGGSEGDAGSLVLSGGVFVPAATQFVVEADIDTFPAGQPLLATDPLCSAGRVTIGHVIEARSASGAPLYRLRLNTARTGLIGGKGGIPSGLNTAGHPGDVGPMGANGTITGVPVQ